MSHEMPVNEPKNKLHSLLLNIDQEVDARKHDEDNFPVIKTILVKEIIDGVEKEVKKVVCMERQFQQGDNQITLLGTNHTNDPARIAMIEASYQTIDPEIVLHEGNNIHDVFAGLSDDEIKALDPAEVMKKQENVYIAWRAFKDGKIVKSWDLSFKDQLKTVAENPKLKEAIPGWLLSIIIAKIHQNKILSISPSSIAETLSVVLSQKDIIDLKQYGVDVGIDNLNIACEQYFGTDLVGLNNRYNADDEDTRKQNRKDDYSKACALMDPAYPGATNQVLRQMNIIRDQHAIDTIEAAKKQHKNILAISGSSHSRTWMPAVAELYK